MRSPLNAIAESNASLWMLAVSPVIWSLHFLASYAVAAAACGRLGGGTIAPARISIASFTVAALAGIVAVGVVGWGWHQAAGHRTPHDADTPEDRRGFMGIATVLLSALSCVGVIYSALAAVFIRTCE